MKQLFLIDFAEPFGAVVQMPVICGKLPNVTLCGSAFMLAPSLCNLEGWVIARVIRDGCNRVLTLRGGLCCIAIAVHVY